MEDKTKKEYMERIYKNVAEKTVKRLEKEKATTVRRRTLKMIALTQGLYSILY